VEGFPESVLRVFAGSKLPELNNMKFVIGLPEYQTPFVGGSAPSQIDILS
jgi:hypothetical protein